MDIDEKILISSTFKPSATPSKNMLSCKRGRLLHFFFSMVKWFGHKKINKLILLIKMSVFIDSAYNYYFIIVVRVSVLLKREIASLYNRKQIRFI